MSIFEQEEKWFIQFINFLSEKREIPVRTTLLDLSLLPFLYLEKTKALVSFDRMILSVTVGVVTGYEGDSQEATLVPPLRTLLSRPLLLGKGASFFKETGLTRKILDKKVRYLALSYDVFIRLSEEALSFPR